MPCFTAQLMQVKLEACDPLTMFHALERLKLRPEFESGSKTVINFANRETIDCATGECTFTALRDPNEIKRAYSTSALEITAEEAGWALEQTGQNQFELTARF